MYSFHLIEEYNWSNHGYNFKCRIIIYTISLTNKCGSICDVQQLTHSYMYIHTDIITKESVKPCFILFTNVIDLNTMYNISI